MGPIIRNRFLDDGISESAVASPVVANPKWKPFTQKTPRQARSSAELVEVSAPQNYHSSKGTMGNVFKICNGFYEHLIEDGLVNGNPFRNVTKKGQYNTAPESGATIRALTPLQWDYVVETAERMAKEAPAKHERTLFILITMFSMYLRISDIAGRANWKPCMGDFRSDPEGNWWFHVVGKGNKAAKVAVRDDYITDYLTRYRRFLGLSPMPEYQEKTPLITTLSG